MKGTKKQWQGRNYETHISDRINEIRLKQQFITLAAAKIFGDNLNVPSDEHRTEIVEGYQLIMEGLESELAEFVTVLDKAS